MSRLARSVFSDIPHHITQRGNRREDVFFTDDDHLRELEINNRPILGRIFVRIQGVVTGA